MYVEKLNVLSILREEYVEVLQAEVAAVSDGYLIDLLGSPWIPGKLISVLS